MPQDPQELYQNTQYTPSGPVLDNQPSIPFNTPTGADKAPVSALDQLNSVVANTKPASKEGYTNYYPIDQVKSDRYPFLIPGADNEDLYGSSQSGWSRAFNGITKGLALTGTTFLQSTAGLVNGVYQAANDGKLSSFYNNDFNKSLDDFNKKLEDGLPNYYTNIEKNAKWYSPSNLLTANFVFDKVVKNMGFMAGAALSGGVYANVLKGIGLSSKLFSIGAAADALTATEDAIVAGEGINGAISRLSTAAQKFTSTFNTLNKGQQAIVAGLSTTGEAGMEAMNVLNEYRQKLIQEYKDGHNGEDPQGLDLDSINKSADDVGNSSFGLNVALLTATNYIQFPKILNSSWKAEKAVANSLSDDINPITRSTEEIFSAKPLSILTKAKNIGGLIFAPSEAFEEGAQYAIEQGTQNYWGKKYRGKDANFLSDLVGYGTEKALSDKEGLESILIGGISGGLTMARGEIRERGILGDKGHVGTNTQAAINAFNQYPDIANVFRDTVDTVNRGTTIAEQQKEAVQQGDEKRAKDLNYDYLHNYLSSRIKYGKMDMVVEDINNYKNMLSIPEGFNQLQEQGIASATDTPESFRSRLDNVLKYAQNMNSLYQALNIKYSGFINDKKERIYSPEVIDKMVYAASKLENITDRIEGINRDLTNDGIVAYNYIQDSTKTGDKTPLEGIIKNIEDSESLTHDQQENILQRIEDLVKLVKDRQQFIKEYNDIRSNPLEYREGKQQSIIPTEEVSTPKKEIILSTNKGDTNIELGEEYTTLSPIPKSFKVVGENPDGSIKIEESDGNTKDVSRNFISSLDVAKTSESPVANYIRENSGEQVEHTLPSGDKVKGNITYNQKEDKIDFDYTDKEGNQHIVDFPIPEDVQQKKQQLALLSNKGDVDAIDKTQDENSSNIETSEVPEEEEQNRQEKVLYEGFLKQKTAQDSITSTITAPSSTDLNTNPRLKKEQSFLSKVPFLPNRKELRALMFTKKQERHLGLTGLIDSMVENTSYNPEEVIAIVYTDGENFVDSGGKPIGKIGEFINPQSVIVSTMPLPAKDTTRARKGEEEIYTQLQEKWAKDREYILNQWKPNEYIQYEFSTSKGFPVKEPSGKFSVVNSIIPKELINQKGILFIPTSPSVNIGEKEVVVTVGRPMINFNGKLTYVNNRKLDGKEIENSQRLITKLCNTLIKERKIDKDIVSYLKGILYWRSDREGKTGRNQIFIDTKTMSLSLGNKGVNIPVTQINSEESQNTLKDFLSNTYNTINNNYLNDNFTKPFREVITTDIEGNVISSVLWKNYQSYLLSSSYITNDENNGKSRQSSLPITTNIRQLSSDIQDDYNSTGQYSTLIKKETVPQVITKKEESVVDVQEEDPLAALGKALGIEEEKVPEVQSIITGTGNQIFYTLEDGNIRTDLPENKELARKLLSVRKEQLGEEQFAKQQKELIGSLQQAFAEQVQFALASPVEENVDNIETGIDLDGFKNLKRNFSVVDEQNLPRLSQEDREEFEKWRKENIPQIPSSFIDELINANNGRQAWGVLSQGLIEVYKNAPKSTPYHEAFEAIYNYFLSPEEQGNILNEFKNRKGTFRDSISQKTINYSDATDLQAKERIADEFGEFKVGKPTIGERIKAFFKKILSFIKSFVLGKNAPSNRDYISSLFDKINKGGFNADVPNIDATEDYYSLMSSSEAQKREWIIQDMISSALNILINDNKENLFNLPQMTDEQIFGKVKEMYKEAGIIKDGIKGEEQWKDLVKRAKDSLRTFNIEFDEEGNTTYTQDEKNRNDYVKESFTTPVKNNATASTKLLIGSLPETEGDSSVGMPDLKTSPIGTIRNINASRVFASLLNRFKETMDIASQIEELYNISKEDGNYVRLYKKLLNTSTDTPEYDLFDKNDWRLLIQFSNTFNKQSPRALAQYISAGEVYSAPVNLRNAAIQSVKGWIYNFRGQAYKNSGYFRYDENKREFYVSPEIRNISTKDVEDKIKFLNSLGIYFKKEDYYKLSLLERKTFNENVSGLKDNISLSHSKILSEKSLGIENRLTKLSILYNKINKPIFSTTFDNVKGNARQEFERHNYVSRIERGFNSVSTIEELHDLYPFMKDTFSVNSQWIKNMFEDRADEYGNVREEKKIKLGYIDGVIDIDNNRGKSSTQLTLGNRYITTINQNLNGDYYIIVPADSSTEWMLNIGNIVSFTNNPFIEAFPIFQKYLLDEMNLAKEYKEGIRKEVLNTKGKGQSLRFFKDILSPTLVSGIEDTIKMGGDFEGFITSNNSYINEDVRKYITNMTKETFKNLQNTSAILTTGENVFSFPLISSDFIKEHSINKDNLNEGDIKNILNYANINFVIANTEIHKVLFGDPYQFKIKKKGDKITYDETKRIKSWLSPREVSFNSPEYNNFAALNNGELIQGVPGYANESGFINLSVVKDIEVHSPLYNTSDVNEADAASYIDAGTYRSISFRNGEWDENKEKFYQWDSAKARLDLHEELNFPYPEELRSRDEKLISTPRPKGQFDILKPIITGVKGDREYIDQVLIKTSQMPIFWSTIQEFPHMKELYKRMLSTGINSFATESAAKVGIENLDSFYNEDGTFKQGETNNSIKVSWDIYGKQVETNTEGKKKQTLGSQLTKLYSLDILKAGVPIDYKGDIKEWNALSEQEKLSISPLYKKVQRVQNGLNNLVNNNYQNLLNRLGIVEGDGIFEPLDKSKASETLRNEMLRREMSEDDIKSLEIDDSTGNFRIPFEATSSYQQIKNILFSIADKSIVRPKVNGKPHVQAPSTLFEKGKRSTITINGKSYLTSNDLKFYENEDGKRYCEVYLPCWFADKVNKKEYDLSTTEGREVLLKSIDSKILEGVGFRIPTQGLNSTEVFVVKGFLDPAFGSTIIVPSDITKKAGSDFDIDKLNTYLKNVYVDNQGNIKLVPKFNSLEEAKTFVDGISSKEQFADLLGEKITPEEDALEDFNFEDNELNINKLSSKLYNQSLENEYFDALRDVISDKVNFERLITPNSNGDLEDIAQSLDDLQGIDEGAIKAPMLDRNYLTHLRHAFSIAKKWVGIGAVNITSHANAQRAGLYIDINKKGITAEDAKYLGDGKVLLPHNKSTISIDGKLRNVISLGETLDRTGKYISDKLNSYLNAFVDVAKDPFILKVVYSEKVLSTTLFLERIGVPTYTAAYFINQPIIKNFINTLDKRGIDYLFSWQMDDVINETLSKFPTEKIAEKIREGQLKNNISTFSSKRKLSKELNGEQQLILNEFIKYAKMAEHVFKFTNATNYDTAKVAAPEFQYKRELNLEKVKNESSISSVENLFEHSSIGTVKNNIDKATEAISSILQFEQPYVREMLNSNLYPYASNSYLGNDDYGVISLRQSTSFVNYLVQTETTSATGAQLSSYIPNFVLNAKENIKDTLETIRKRDADNPLLNNLVIITPQYNNGGYSLKTKSPLSDAYDKNLFTSYMREFKLYYPKEYKDILYTLMLQNDKSIPIPIEDYSQFLIPIVEKIKTGSIENLYTFADNYVFQKNNWKNEQIVPSANINYYENQYTGLFETMNFKSITINNQNASLLLLSSKYAAKAANKPIVTVPRITYNKKINRYVDNLYKTTITSKERAELVKKGDPIIKQVLGYQQVFNADNTAFITNGRNKGEKIYYYKPINLLGTTEIFEAYQNEGAKSELFNNTLPIENTLVDEDIINSIKGNKTTQEEEIEQVLNQLDKGC